MKANFHFHTKEDPDVVDYTLFEGIDKAVELGFEVLASTCHGQMMVTDAHRAYAREKRILLIPGLEAEIYEEGTQRRNHVVLLNCDASANAIHTFKDLGEYRRTHPEMFVLAAHPYFYGNFSLQERLEKYIDFFDGIEHSWFYTHWFNRNKQGKETAQKYNKPFIATSDTHFFDFMNTNYTVIDAKEKTIKSVLRALRECKYQNVTSPRSLADIFITFGRHEMKVRAAKKISYGKK